MTMIILVLSIPAATDSTAPEEIKRTTMPSLRMKYTHQFVLCGTSASCWAQSKYVALRGGGDSAEEPLSKRRKVENASWSKERVSNYLTEWLARAKASLKANYFDLIPLFCQNYGFAEMAPAELARLFDGPSASAEASGAKLFWNLHRDVSDCIIGSLRCCLQLHAC